MKIGYLVNEAKGFLDQYKSQSPAAFAAAQQAIGGLLILDGFTGIDNPFGGKNRPGIFGSIGVIITGIIFIIAPTIFGNISGINKLTSTTNATVVSVGQPQQTTTTDSNGNKQTSSSCDAVASYTVNGQQFSKTSSYGSSSLCGLSTGQSIQINYNPNNPGQWGTEVKGISSLLKIFFYVGIFTVIVGIITFVIRLLSIIFGWKLLKSGRTLAKTLPPGTDLKTAINEIENSFKTSLFGFKGGATVNQQGLGVTPAIQNQQPMTTQPVAPTQPVQTQPNTTQVTPTNQGQQITPQVQSPSQQNDDQQPHIG